MANTPLSIQTICFEFHRVLIAHLQFHKHKTYCAKGVRLRLGDTLLYRVPGAGPLAFDGAPSWLTTEACVPIMLAHEAKYNIQVDPRDYYLSIDQFSQHYILPCAVEIMAQLLLLWPKNGTLITAPRLLPDAATLVEAATAIDDTASSAVYMGYDAVRDLFFMRFSVICGFYGAVVSISPWSRTHVSLLNQEKRRLNQRLLELRKTA